MTPAEVDRFNEVFFLALFMQYCLCMIASMVYASLRCIVRRFRKRASIVQDRFLSLERVIPRVFSSQSPKGTGND